MRNYQLPSDISRQKEHPFVCFFMPLVSNKIPITVPLIRKNIPTVGKWKNLGFSVTELLIVVTIVGILSMIAAPGMMNFVRDSRLSSNANDLIADIVLARNEALKRNTPVVICKTSDATVANPVCNVGVTAADTWTPGWIVFVDTNDDGLRTLAGTPEQMIRVHGAMANTISLNAASTNLATNLIFRPSGRPAGFAGGTFALCDTRGAASARAIIVVESGRPRISDQRNASGIPLGFGTAIVPPAAIACP